MTDAKFKQLVNSFLDREISQKDHLLLAREIASSPQRRTEFERHRKLHAAERQALAKLFGCNETLERVAYGDADAAGGPGAGVMGAAAVAGGGAATVSEERRQMAERLKARAARAWSEVQLLAVERKKRTMLIFQFALSAILIVGGALLLYRQSVKSIPGSSLFRKESEAVINADSLLLVRLSERLRANRSISVEWISNERGEPVALIGRNVEGGVFVLTAPELPQLNHSQLAVMMNQLQSSDAPTAARSRFIVSTQSSTKVLPEIDHLLPQQLRPPAPAPVVSAASALQISFGPSRAAAEPVAVDMPSAPAAQEPAQTASYHTVISTAPAEEPLLDFEKE